MQRDAESDKSLTPSQTRQVALDLAAAKFLLGAFVFGTLSAAQAGFNPNQPRVQPYLDEFLDGDIPDMELKRLWDTTSAQVKFVQGADNFLRHARDAARNRLNGI